MIFRNIIIGWRNIRKNGIYSVINIAGLALGVAVVVLILLWIVDELSYDKFNKNLNRIYTVYEHQQYSEGQELHTFCTPFPLSQELSKNYPGVEAAATFTNLGKLPIKFEGKEYKEGPVYCADNNFLKIFSYDILEGDRNTLSSTDQIIITDELARLYFGTESAIGKVLKFDNQYSFTVGAVIATQHANSTLDFKVLIPIEFVKTFGADLTRWGNNWPRTSVLLAEGGDAKNLEAKIANLCKEKGQENTTLHLFPFKDEHLYSFSGKNNRIQYIYQFLGIALIIILIASINFINLSITKAEQRSPEVGVRKVMGADKINILKQFLLEKGIMIFLSILLSIILIFLFLPLFRAISDKHIILGQLQNTFMVLMLLTGLLIILGLSVVYPSLYLSSINPVQALKKYVNTKRKNFSLKSLLVVVQFTLAIILISGSIIITKQIKYVNNYDLGYDHANLIYLTLDGEAKSRHEAIKQELESISGVESITRSDKLPLWGGNSSWGYDWEGKDPENKVLICSMNVDKEYFKTMGIKLVDGNSFPNIYDKVQKYDDLSSPQVILNQEAIRRMGIKDPVGKYFGESNKKGVIIGVVEDFHFESLHSSVEPLLLLPLFDNPGYIIARISPENFSQTLDKVKKSWSKVLPQTTCEIGFFDDQLSKLYISEVKISRLFRYFSLVAIFISCIGLFGLSLFIIERRRREVGIRKVNGAKISEVIILLNKDFIKWVVIAFMIAVPVAWYIMHQWLGNFAFRTTLSWWIFVMSGLIAIVIALLTVSWQSMRAATRNPVEALRYE
ncbi:MAG TPA: ABC transporter permease [Bacteroidales bacterium]|nr:ABC transporter permease [Bacteroidales bacterium]HPT20888.1 ABC transporter permease [Bacteroidales bacterium]